MTIRVLNLVTDDTATFFEEQVRALSRRDVEMETLTVPGATTPGGQRSPTKYLRFWPRAIRASLGPYDVVHANSGLTAPAAVSQLRLPVVVTFWGTDLMGRYGRVTAACARLADEVIVMSEEMAERYGHDCHVVPHGVDLDRFRPLPDDVARSRIGWDQRPYQVLFPYTAARSVKNHPRARRVVDAVDERLPKPVELQTVSGVPHDQMSLYYNAADALLLTSHREGSPNSVKEAMACNLPVVSTDVGDVRDRLEPVSNSYVSDDDEELVESLYAILRDGRQSDGRRYARDVGLDHMAERIESIYRDVLDEPRSEETRQEDISIPN